MTSFLVDIFRSPDPERDGRTITVAEMLDKAKTRVETEFKEDKLLAGQAAGGDWGDLLRARPDPGNDWNSLRVIVRHDA